MLKSRTLRFDEAKARADLVALFAGYGVTLSKNGHGLRGLCPFHPDNEPSLSVTPEKGLWHCFGCGKGGSAIDLLVIKEGIGPDVAVDRLLAFAPRAVASEPARSSVEVPSELLDGAAAHYAASLEKALKARNYLASRGLLDPELLSRFAVGYGDGTIKATVARDVGEAAGVLNERGVDFFYRSITFPLRDENGRVVSFYGRHTQLTRHLYLRGPHRGLLNGEALRGAESIVLTESVIDALSAIRLGIKASLPLYGVNGLTADHREAIAREGVREVTLLLDNDEAGERAAASLTEALRPLEVAVFQARLPVGIKDVNAFLVKGRAPDELQGLLASRTPLHLPVQRIAPVPAAPPTAVPAGAAALTLVPPATPPADPLATVGEIPTVAPSEDVVIAGLMAYKDGIASFEFDGVRYEIKGIRLRPGDTTLRVVITIGSDAGSFRDRPDLYLHRSRRAFALESAERLGLEPALVEAHLHRLTEAIETIREREVERLEAGRGEGRRPLTEEEQAEAMTLLLAPDLLVQVAADVDRLGYVGETETKKLAYLVATSRKTERPLSCIVRSSSGAGKSRLIEVVAELMPEEEVELFSRITPQSLYYMGRDELAHKLLVIDERAGGEDADYSIRSLQTRKKLTLAAPIKDPSSGKIRTTTFEVNGPVALMESTTQATINAENANRCFELYLDESEVQTRRIHEAQRRAYGPRGWAADAERERIVARHRNAQRLLRPLRVSIPFAEKIRFPATWLRTRRDHERFLALVAMRAFLYQHQRPARRDEAGREYIEATVEDYAEAYQLAHAVLASTLQDLSKPGQDLVSELRSFVAHAAVAKKVPATEVSFTRRDLRDALRWPDHKLRDTVKELVDLEEVEVVAGRNGAKFVYRLAAQRHGAAEVLSGLSAPEEIATAIGAH